MVFYVYICCCRRWLVGGLPAAISIWSRSSYILHNILFICTIVLCILAVTSGIFLTSNPVNGGEFEAHTHTFVVLFNIRDYAFYIYGI